MTHDLEPHSQTRPYRQAEEAVWEAARSDYEAGCSAPVVAERHGLGERTVRRRAAAEGWRRPARTAEAAAGLALLYSRVQAGLAGPDAEGDAQIDADPHLEGMIAAHTFEVGRLLMAPTPERLSRFAFRRAAEGAARGGAAECLGWLRVCNALDRSEASLRHTAQPFSLADHLRASLAARLEELEEGRAEEEEDAGEDAAPALPGLEMAAKGEKCPDGRMAGVRGSDILAGEGGSPEHPRPPSVVSANPTRSHPHEL